MISALGRVVRIDTSALEQHDRDALRRVWADADANVPGDAAADGGVVVAPADRETDQLLSLISRRVTGRAIAARRGELWMLHAGAVADEKGRVVVVIGPSGRGKTTAMRALGQHHAYVTDETVAIEADGVIHPYRKPLSIIERVGAVKAQRPPGELGLGALPAVPLRLAALVLLDRRVDGPDAAELDVCDLGEALVELAEQTSYLADLPRPLQTIAAHATAVGGIHRVVYREAESLVGALSPLFRDPAPVVLEAEAQSGTRLRDADGESVGGWHRAAHLDALVLDGSAHLALLQAGADGDGMLRVLSGIGPALWANADGRSTHDLVLEVISAHGEPGTNDAAQIVDAAISELAAQGLLSRREEAGPAGADTQFQNSID